MAVTAKRKGLVHARTPAPTDSTCLLIRQGFSVVVCNLASAIAECLHLHAQAKDRLDTEYPERLPRVPEAVRAKVIRQRERVSNTLSGVTPEQHVAEIESLNAGLRLILKKLVSCGAQSRLDHRCRYGTTSTSDGGPSLWSRPYRRTSRTVRSAWP